MCRPALCGSKPSLACFLPTLRPWNRYSYALNNPLILIDPTGLTSEEANLIPECKGSELCTQQAKVKAQEAVTSELDCDAAGHNGCGNTTTGESLTAKFKDAAEDSVVFAAEVGTAAIIGMEKVAGAWFNFWMAPFFEGDALTAIDTSSAPAHVRIGAVMGEVGAATAGFGVARGPTVVRAGARAATSTAIRAEAAKPGVIRHAGDFFQGFAYPTPPPSTLSGQVGFAVRQAIDKLIKALY